jgi:hypothetical protein
MAILALVVLVVIAPGAILGMLQGAIAILEAIWIVICSLWRFFWSLGRTDHHSKVPPNRPNARSSDPTTRKLREMRLYWEHQGHRVGLVNLETGEVFEPVSETQESERLDG